LYKIFNVLISSFLIIFFLFLLPKIQGGIFGLHADDFGIISWVFIANIIASGLLFVALLPHIKSLSFKIDSALLSKMLKYSYPLVIIGIANGIIQFFGTPLQEWFLSGTSEENLAQAGIYDTTRRIASLFVMFTTAFNYAAEPFFFNNSTSSDREELYGKICRLFTLIGGLIIVTMVLSVDLIQYIVGSNFRASLNLLPILLMAYLFLGIYYNVSIWYKLSDKTKYGAIISILGMSITLIMSIILLPIIGYSASALATLFSYAIMVFIGYIWGQKHYPIDYPMKKIVIDLFVIIAVISIASYIHAFNLITLKYICFPVLFIVYVSYAFLMEKKEWLSLVRKSN